MTEDHSIKKTKDARNLNIRNFFYKHEKDQINTLNLKQMERRKKYENGQ